MVTLEAIQILSCPSSINFIFLTFVFKELGKVGLNFYFNVLGHLNNFSIPSYTHKLFIFQKGPPPPKVCNSYYLLWCWVPSFPHLSIHSVALVSAFVQVWCWLGGKLHSHSCLSFGWCAETYGYHSNTKGSSQTTETFPLALKMW